MRRETIGGGIRGGLAGEIARETSGLNNVCAYPGGFRVNNPDRVSEEVP